MPDKLYPNLAKGSYFLGFMASTIYTAALLTVLIAMIRETDVLKSGVVRESLGPTLGFVILYATAAALIGLLMGLVVVFHSTQSRKHAVFGIILSLCVLVPTAIITLIALQ